MFAEHCNSCPVLLTLHRPETLLATTTAGGFAKWTRLEEHCTRTDNSSGLWFHICPFLVNDVLVLSVAKSGIRGKEAVQHPAGVCSPKERAEKVRASVVPQFIETSTSVDEQDQGLGCASGDGIKHCSLLCASYKIRTPNTKCDCSLLRITECVYDVRVTSSTSALFRSLRFEPSWYPTDPPAARFLPGILAHVPAAGAVSISDRSHI